MTNPQRRLALFLGCVAVLLGVIGPTLAAGSYVRPGRTVQADLTSSGGQALRSMPDLSGNAWHYSSISANGRYVAFDSWASNLVAGDVNHVDDVFVRDRATGRTVLASVASDGTHALPGASAFSNMNGSTSPYLSANGRFVAYESGAPNLVVGDTNLTTDVFVHDLVTGRTQRVSVSSSGAQANNVSLWPSLSADGRYVAFASNASNLVDGDTNGVPDVFVADRQTGKVTLASIRPDGAPFGSSLASAQNLAPSISPDGRFVAFTQTTVGPQKAYFETDVYVRDLVKHRTVQVDVASDGTPQPAGSDSATPWTSRASVMSADDRYVAFVSSTGIGLVPNPSRHSGLFVHDLTTGTTRAAAVGYDGAAPDDDGGPGVSISADGRFVAYDDKAANLDLGYGNHWSIDPLSCVLGAVTSCAPFRTFVHDMVTGATVMVSRADDGTDPQPPFPQCGFGTIAAKPDLWYPSISPGGRYVAFGGCGLLREERVNADKAPVGYIRETEHNYVREIGLPLGAGQLVASGRLTLAGTSSFRRQGIAQATRSAGGAQLDAVALAYRPEYGDLFARVGVPKLSLLSNGLAYGLDFTVDGSAYEVRIGGTGAVASFELYRAGPAGWARVGTLHGGYGTTGEEIVVAVPLAAVGAAAGGAISGVAAFADLAGSRLDTLRLSS